MSLIPFRRQTNFKKGHKSEAKGVFMTFVDGGDETPSTVLSRNQSLPLSTSFDLSLEPSKVSSPTLSFHLYFQNISLPAPCLDNEDDISTSLSDLKKKILSTKEKLEKQKLITEKLHRDVSAMLLRDPLKKDIITIEDRPALNQIKFEQEESVFYG